MGLIKMRTSLGMITDSNIRGAFSVTNVVLFTETTFKFIYYVSPDSFSTLQKDKGLFYPNIITVFEDWC